MPSTLGVIASTWTPAKLSPALWLDAADTTTITASSGAVSEWRDKSGNARHVSQATTSAQPTTGTHTINSIGVVRFSGAQFLQAATAMDWKFLTDGSVKYVIAAVANVGASSDPNARYPILGNYAFSAESPTYPMATFVFGFDDRASASRNNTAYFLAQQFLPNTARTLVVTPNESFTPQSPTILTVLADNANATASQRAFVSINGGAAINNNTQTGALSTANPFRPLAVGWRDNMSSANYLVGSVGEIVIASGAEATDTNLALLRNYLNAKWAVY